jgi:hypothetical protein
LAGLTKQVADGGVMKKLVVTNVRVISDIDRAISWSRDMEHYAKQAESLASEFNEFVRDHRSMDWVYLHVEREYENQCSHCHNLWEEDESGCPVCCQAAIEEYESSKVPA